MTTPREFTPALGRPELTSQYDQVIAIMTRERRWRARLLAALAPAAGETIVDLGSGTGSMALLIKEAVPGCRMTGVDPDPEVLAIARAKIEAAGQQVELVEATGDAPGLEDEVADKVISSLVLHQCSQAAKEGLLANAFRLLKPGGLLLIADYGLQRTPLMSMLFRQVRALDGYENTRANKDGEIPGMIAAAGFQDVSELSVTPTPTGSISIYLGRKAGA
ncbi:MAG: class I SAM-dependent methyltransferase [Phenylobacterium sp.]|uniref:class I SAM-dependent methyltransferase n=1 Tax=Phenylobacterium sp. TaxID=1871053 RepID=UPI001A32BB03|nr:class I SAM-dependent methyltransferase [Phenylobacterium sp.]MBJ7411252.1 class I SAM-dependent methyltransferase [Phenylobacterium sp.]